VLGGCGLRGVGLAFWDGGGGRWLVLVGLCGFLGLVGFGLVVGVWVGFVGGLVWCWCLVLCFPYAAQAVAGQDFPSIFYIPRGEPQLAHVAELGKRQAKRMAEQLRDKLATNPSLEYQARGFVTRTKLERLAEMGILGIGTAPTTSS